ADQGGEAHPRAGHRLLPVELGAPEAALELEHHAADTAVADQQVVAAADDVDRELLPLGERQRAADVFHVLRDDEDVRGTPNTQGGVEAERLLESDLAPALSQHALSPLGWALGVAPEPLEQFPAQLAHVAGPESEHEITRS